MKTLSKFISLATLLAIAANPVLAAAIPCCCTKPAGRACSCCGVANVPPAARGVHSCCGEKPSPPPATGRGPGCCCVKTPPALVPARDHRANLPLDDQVVLVAVCTLDRSPGDPRDARPRRSSGHLGLHGPPLLALYCIWLN